MGWWHRFGVPVQLYGIAVILDVHPFDYQCIETRGTCQHLSDYHFIAGNHFFQHLADYNCGKCHPFVNTYLITGLREYSNMFDRNGINQRYLSCFPGVTPRQLAKRLGIKHPMVYQWIANKRTVPWAKLKIVTDTMNITWDWLLDGREPKSRLTHSPTTIMPFDRHGINQRFLSLFPHWTQKRLGDHLGVSQMTVYRWHHDMSQVPWGKLRYAVDIVGVTWDWLIEGR